MSPILAALAAVVVSLAPAALAGHALPAGGTSARAVDTRQLEWLLGATRDPVWKKRWDAVNELGNLKDPRGVPALVERALYDENPHPRWRSLWALSSIDRRGNAAVAPLLRALGSADPNVVHNSAVALAFFKRPEGRFALLQSIVDTNEFRRWESIFSLRSIANAATADAVISRLDPKVEPSVKVRGEAALALGRMGQWQVAPALIQTLATDSEPGVRWRAAISLRSVGQACLVPRLWELEASELDVRVRKQLGATLVKLARKVHETGVAEPRICSNLRSTVEDSGRRSTGAKIGPDGSNAPY